MDLQNTHVSENTSQKDVNAICMFLQDLAAAENLSAHSSCAKAAPGFQPVLRELPEILEKKDAEINSLSKCNTELSETVVCLRQEIYALRKEKINSDREWKESRSKLLMVSERNAALVQELSKLNLENQKLKMEMLALTKERCKPALYSPIGHPDLPFNTYPWLFPTERSIPPFLSSPLYQVNNSLIKSYRENSNSEIESCEEISQKLFAQMKMEMEELDKQQCMENISENEDIYDSCIEYDDENLSNSNTSTGISLSENEVLKMEDIIAHLEHELVAVRFYALEQNRFIREMLQKVLNFTKASSSDSPSVGLQSNERITSVPLSECSEAEVTDNRFQFPRPSDESFRAYFTQQLSGSQQPPLSGTHKSISEERLRTMQMISGDNNSTSTFNIHSIHKGKTGIEGFNLVTYSSAPENRSEREITTASESSVNSDTAAKTVVLSRPVLSPNKISKDEGKICPMCQAVFSKTTTQDEFEAHVFSHFEAENSILENFEVIQY